MKHVFGGLEKESERSLHELPQRRISVPVEEVLFTQRKISSSFRDPSLPSFRDLIAALNAWRVRPDEEDDFLELEAVTYEHQGRRWYHSIENRRLSQATSGSHESCLEPNGNHQHESPSYC